MYTDLTSLEEIDHVVEDTNQFKIKLAIGDDAYATLKLAKGLQAIWDTKEAAATGAKLASSATVASTFFGGSSTGLLSAFGYGAAVTPLGWVIAAAVASGGAYYGVMSLSGRYKDNRVVKIPKFINTPIDLLGATLFDLIGGLGVKIAQLSNDFDYQEKVALADYFVEEWGLNREYVLKCIPILEDQVKSRNLKEMVKSLAEFQIDNPDCNPSAMKRDILEFLSEIALADGEIDEREEMSLEIVERELNQHLSLTSKTLRTITNNVKAVGNQANKVASTVENKTSQGINSTLDNTSRIAMDLSYNLGKVVGRVLRKRSR